MVLPGGRRGFSGHFLTITPHKSRVSTVATSEGDLNDYRICFLKTPVLMGALRASRFPSGKAQLSPGFFAQSFIEGSTVDVLIPFAFSRVHRRLTPRFKTKWKQKESQEATGTGKLAEVADG